MLLFRLLPTTYCLLLLATPVSSEPMGWAATYGGVKSDHASSTQQTHDGGYIVGGWTDSFGAGGRDIWVLKLRPDGTVEWQKSYGGDSSDSANATQQTSDGGYIVAGNTNSFSLGRHDLWVLKLGTDGTVEWQKTYGGAEGTGAESIQQTSDGGYIVAGHAGFNVWVLKLRPDGTIEWQKTYAGFGYDWVYCIHATSDGGYIMAGDTSHSSTKGGDLWVLKLRPDGTIEWQKAYGGDELDRAHCIHETRDGGYIVAGMTDSSCVGRGFPDIWVLKLRPDGTVEWQKVYGVWYGLGYELGRAGWDEAKAIHETSDGGYILLGLTGCGDVVRGARGSVNNAVLLLKLRADGTIEWQKTYGERGFLWPQAIHETRDGGYVVAADGLYRTRGDICILKLNPDGSIGHPCDFPIGDASISVLESNARVLDTQAVVMDSDVSPREPAAIVLTTDVSPEFLCH